MRLFKGKIGYTHDDFDKHELSKDAWFNKGVQLNIVVRRIKNLWPKTGYDLNNFQHGTASIGGKIVHVRRSKYYDAMWGIAP